MATRRASLSGDRRKEFDAHYGKPKSSRSEAGKGDTARDVDKELYDAGYEAAYGATPEIRAAAAERWRRLRREQASRRDA
jgi:hypothetical protein